VEKHFDFGLRARSANTFAGEGSRNDLGIVKDDYVASAQETRQIDEKMVGQLLLDRK
jgi:hypothetical protein